MLLFAIGEKLPFSLLTNREIKIMRASAIFFELFVLF
nr:MAG TPA: hypothetical protein [Caudoviricetes sp.]